MKEDKSKKNAKTAKSKKTSKQPEEIPGTGRSKRLGPVIPRIGFKPKSMGGDKYGCGGRLK